MVQLLWDASGLAKRYYEEIGSETADALFAATPPPIKIGTFMGYAETAAILRRRLNRGDFNMAAFSTARNALRTEVFDDPEFVLLTVEDADIVNGIGLTDRHNLNSTDAAILAAFLRYAQALPAESPPCILVAADQRLLRSAILEGLLTLNPELTPAADVPALLSGIALAKPSDP